MPTLPIWWVSLIRYGSHKLLEELDIDSECIIITCIVWEEGVFHWSWQIKVFPLLPLQEGHIPLLHPLPNPCHGLTDKHYIFTAYCTSTPPQAMSKVAPPYISIEVLTLRSKMDVQYLYKQFPLFASSINLRGLFPQDWVVLVPSMVCDGRFRKYNHWHAIS